MIVKLLTEHDLECLSLKTGCTGSSESPHVKMPHCWKSHALAQIFTIPLINCFTNIYAMVFNRGEARSQNYRQLRSSTLNRISNKS